MANDKLIRVCLDLTEVNSLHKYIWVPVVFHELKTIHDFKLVLRSKFALDANKQISLFVQGSLLPEQETIHLLRENDVIKVIYKNESPFGNESLALASNEISKKINNEELINSKKDKKSKDKILHKNNNFDDEINVLNQEENVKVLSFSTKESQSINAQQEIHSLPEKKKKAKTKDYPELFNNAQFDVPSTSTNKLDNFMNLNDNKELNDENQRMIDNLLNHSKKKKKKNHSNSFCENDNALSIIPNNFENHLSSDIPNKTINCSNETNVSKIKDADLLIKKKRRRRKKRKLMPEENEASLSMETKNNIIFDPDETSASSLINLPKHIKYDDDDDQILKDNNQRDFQQIMPKDQEVHKGNASKKESFNGGLFGEGNKINFQENKINFQENQQVDYSNKDSLNDVHFIKIENGLLQASTFENKKINMLQNTSTPIILNQENKSSNSVDSCLAFDITNENFKSNVGNLGSYSIYTMPSIGNHIKFKILELSETYCPVVSEVKEGIIRSIDQENGEVQIELIQEEQKIHKGKFENIYPNAPSPEPEIIKTMTVKWTQLIEPKLIFSF